MIRNFLKRGLSSAELFEKEAAFGATNYAPIRCAINRAEGVYMWDVEDKRYFDFLSAYSAVNQGHCHPKIIDAAVQQMKVTIVLLSSTSLMILDSALDLACIF